jgi:hypothetical protein
MLGRSVLSSSVIALGFFLYVGNAFAQDAAPVRVRGEIAGISANSVTIKTGSGESKLELAPDAKVFVLAPANAEAVATEAFIGAAGPQPQKERVKAAVVVVYSQGSAGTSDDYLTWDLTPDSTMRNGVVRSVENGPDGRVVSLSYPQGGATVVIPPEATVMTLTQADHALLKKGAHIFVPSAEKRSDGTFMADMVAVGKDGFKPPL